MRVCDLCVFSIESMKNWQSWKKIIASTADGIVTMRISSPLRPLPYFLSLTITIIQSSANTQSGPLSCYMWHGSKIVFLPVIWIPCPITGKIAIKITNPVACFNIWSMLILRTLRWGKRPKIFFISCIFYWR